MGFKFNPFTKKLDYFPKLDDCEAPDDNTDLDASTSKHGLLLKLGGGISNFLRADGTWNAPAGAAHTHDADTLQLDGVNSDGGAFAFTTSGAVTFSQDVLVDGGNIGITADPDLMTLASGILTITGAIRTTSTGYIGDTTIRSTSIEINGAGSGNRLAYIDFIGDDTYTDYGLRLMRWSSGANSNSSLEHRGTGTFSIITDEAGPISLNTDSTVRLTIGATGAIAIASGATLGFAVGTTINEFSIDDTLGGDSDDVVPTEQAVKAYVDARVVPTGAVIATADDAIPTGYLECDGSTISRSTYSALFAVIGEMYGDGDQSTTFEIPDYRGKFIRGMDNGAGNDPDAGSRTDRGDTTGGDAVGTQQADGFKAHTHTVSKASGNPTAGVDSSDRRGSGNDIGGQVVTESTGGNETRPVNVNVIYCIKT